MNLSKISRFNFVLNSNFLAHRWRCKHLQHLDRLDVVALALKEEVYSRSKSLGISCLLAFISQQLLLEVFSLVVAPATPSRFNKWLGKI